MFVWAYPNGTQYLRHSLIGLKGLWEINDGTHRVPAVPSEVSRWDQIDNNTESGKQPIIRRSLGYFGGLGGAGPVAKRPVVCQYSGKHPPISLSSAFLPQCSRAQISPLPCTTFEGVNQSNAVATPFADPGPVARATVTRVGGALEMWSRAGVSPGVGAEVLETSVQANWVACFRRCGDNLACQSIAVSPFSQINKQTNKQTDLIGLRLSDEPGRSLRRPLSTLQRRIRRRCPARHC